MARNSATQEVGCVVALSTLLYPALLHRKLTTATNSTAVAAAASEQTGGHPREVCVPGSVLEVRQLWQPPPAIAESEAVHTTEEGAGTAPVFASNGVGPTNTRCTLAATSAQNDSASLYAFVRVKDADHRLSGWFPLHQVYVKLESALAAFGDGPASPNSVCTSSDAVAGVSVAAARGLTEDWVALSHVLRRPWLSSVYDEVTPGMARTQRARRQLDYLEERLLRDCRTPTTVRYFIYLNTYVFAPWYYSPFGLLNSEYDPTLPYGGECGGGGGSGGDLQTPVGASTAGGAAAAVVASPPLPPQPYIRDAFLCPFSLRIFSTYSQLHYETRTYRAGRLRPPGEEIYRDDERGLSLFRINGSQHVTYCRQLFLIGKSFLENKLAGHDVQSYYFYVVCLHYRYFPNYVSDESAMFFAGFFTWEKHVCEYNLACIATLPCFGHRARPRRPSSGTSSSPGKHQRDNLESKSVAAAPPTPPPVLRNIGQFMIAVSYELAYRRNQIGTPEKPLSDLGAAAYHHYWRRVLVRWMKAALSDVRRATAVDVDVDGVTNASTSAAAAAAAALEQQSDVDGERSVVTVVMMVDTDRGEVDHRREEGGDIAAHAGPAAGKRKRSRVGARGSITAADAADNGKNDAADTVAQATGEDEVDTEDFARRRRPLLSSAGDRSVRGAPAAAASFSTTASSVAPKPPTTPADHPASSVAMFTSRTTIKEIAAAVRLEEADVLKTLLGLGVLHRSSEDRSIQLLLPQRYVDWMHDEILRWESSTSHAVFRPSLLKSRGRTKQ
jgi:hypothetical protein